MISRSGFSIGAGYGSHSPAAVEHFADALADVAGALGIGLQAARDIRMFQRFLDAEENRLGGEQAFLGADGFGERIAALLRRRRPSGRAARSNPPRRCARDGTACASSRRSSLARDQHEAGFVQAAAAGAAEHLQNLIGRKRLLDCRRGDRIRRRARRCAARS